MNRYQPGQHEHMKYKQLGKNQTITLRKSGQNMTKNMVDTKTLGNRFRYLVA